MNANYVYDPNSEIPIGNNKDVITTLYGDYCSFTTQSGSKPKSSKEFSPEIVRLGGDFLIKEKRPSGFVIRGLQKNLSGGVIEKIISMKSGTTSINPANPAYPATKSQNQDCTTTPALQSKLIDPAFTLHSEDNSCNFLQGDAGSSPLPASSLQPPETTSPSNLQTTQSDFLQGMQGKNELHAKEEKIINSIPDNLSLTQKIIQAWHDPPVLGKIVLSADGDELLMMVVHYTPEQIAVIKEAAASVWQPQVEGYADYLGEKVAIWERNQSRFVVVLTQNGSKQKVKRGNLKPWLGI